MYISDAMKNMRGDSLGSVANNAVPSLWVPYGYAPYTEATIQSGSPGKTNFYGCGFLFSTGDVIPDSLWQSIQSSVYTLATLRTLLSTSLPNCVMDSAYATVSSAGMETCATGELSLTVGQNTSSTVTYAKPFNRMYLFVSNVTTTMAATVAVESYIEFTPQDLISMGASLTDNGDGTFTLNGSLVLGKLNIL